MILQHLGVARFKLFHAYDLIYVEVLSVAWHVAAMSAEHETTVSVYFNQQNKQQGSGLTDCWDIFSATKTDIFPVRVCDD